MRGTRQTHVQDARHGGGRGDPDHYWYIYLKMPLLCKWLSFGYFYGNTVSAYEQYAYNKGQYIIESLRRQLYVPLESPQPWPLTVDLDSLRAHAQLAEVSGTLQRRKIHDGTYIY